MGKLICFCQSGGTWAKQSAEQEKGTFSGSGNYLLGVWAGGVEGSKCYAYAYPMYCECAPDRTVYPQDVFAAKGTACYSSTQPKCPVGFTLFSRGMTNNLYCIKD